MGHTYGESDRNPMGAAGYGPVPHASAPGGMTWHAVTVGWDNEAVEAK